MLTRPSANDFKLPHTVDFFGSSAPSVWVLEMSLDNGSMALIVTLKQ
jgi:hypothetical protein